MWHLRLGHPSLKRLQRLGAANALTGLPQRLADDADAGPLPAPVCGGCALGKAHRVKFQRQRDPIAAATQVLERVHADLCGPVVVRQQETEQ